MGKDMYNHVALSYPGLLTLVFVPCSTNAGTQGRPGKTE